jgi:hypothetical protein
MIVFITRLDSNLEAFSYNPTDVALHHAISDKWINQRSDSTVPLVLS